MSPILAVIASGVLLATSAWAGVYPKETCGIDSAIKQFEFAHQGAMMDDAASLEFNKDGGFKLYDENGTNHTWELDAAGLILTRRNLTRGDRTHINYNFDAVPRGTQNTDIPSGNDWTIGFERILHDIVNMETTFVQTHQSESQVLTALHCAQSIVINALARGQERLLEGKTR